MFVFFNLTFFPLFLVGLLGQPRRVFEYAQNLQALNDFSSVSAFLLGASFLFFIANFVWSIFINPKPAPANPWNSTGPRVADADTGARLQLRADPGGASPTPTTTAKLTPRRRRSRAPVPSC